MHTYDRFYVGGEWITPAGTGTIETISPHTEQPVGRVPEGTPADMDRAVAAAREASPSPSSPRRRCRSSCWTTTRTWPATTPGRRAGRACSAR